MAGRRLAAALTALVVVAVGAFLWWQVQRADRAEREAGLAASRALTATFARTSALEVAHLTGEVLARVDATSGYGMFADTQTTRAPYEVRYMLDLTSLTPSDYRWDGEHKTMFVTVPGIAVSAPTIDMARARTTQTGVFISRTAGLAMQRQAATRLALAAGAKATQPDYLQAARESARGAVERLVRAPLAAAGMDDVRVVVRLPGEARPAGVDREQWDMSRPLAEVLAD